MLGSGTLTTRMGGIYALERLAQDHPKDYHAQIMNLLCAFARYRTEPEAASAADKTGEAEASKRSEQKCPPDVAAAVKAVGKCRKRLRDKDTLEKIEKGTSEKSDREPDWTLNLTRVNLTGADLTGADLTGADLEDTILVWVDLKGANLKGAILVGVDLKGADLEGADLEGVDLTGADLEGADLTGAIGLTQEMLLSAQPSSPPKSLPDGLSWPFEEGTDGKWRPKP
ncbi:MAG: pentapeptide repeat-containing protein [Rhodospirillales bacterium]|nr:pentapeptide repeat-containing protein [Rhodospirillales bacterium]